MANNKKKSTKLSESFWRTFAVVITAVAALITAIGTILANPAILSRLWPPPLSETPTPTVLLATFSPSNTPPIPIGIPITNPTLNLLGFCVVHVQDNPPFGMVYYLSKYNVAFDSVEVYYRCELDSASKSCLKEIKLEKASGHFVLNFGDFLVIPSVSQEACTQPDSLWVLNATGQ